MAATTSVGANTTLSGVASGVPSALVQQSIPTWLDDVQRRDTPLLNAIKKGGPVNQNSTTLSWGWASLRPLNDQLAAAYTSGGTTLTVDNQARFQVNDVIQIENEKFHVTAYVSTNQLTVVGAWEGTSAANHADNAGIMILGPCFRENQDTTLVPITQGEVETNYYQQFEFKLQASHQRQNIDSFETMGRGKALAYYTNKLLKKEGPVLMERTLIHGLRQAQSATVAGTMGGVNQPAFTANRVTTSGALTPTALLDAIYTAWEASEEAADMTMMLHPKMARRVSSWFSGMRTAEATEDTVRMHFTRFITPYGTLTMMPNRHWVKPGTVDGTPTVELDSILIADFKDFELIPFSSDSTWNISFRRPPYTDFWGDLGFMRGLYSLRAANPYTRTYISGFSTTASDYPNAV